MAEITKVTTPIIPQENVGKYKPVSDQAFDLTDPSKVHEPRQEGKIADQGTRQRPFWDQEAGPSFLPLLQPAGGLAQGMAKLLLLIRLGVSAGEIIQTDPIRQELEELFFPPGQLPEIMTEQAESSILFHGAAFDALREVMGRFGDQPAVEKAVAHLLKVFEQYSNGEYSIKAVLNSCRNILGYLYTKDREQFEGYLKNLEEALFPVKEGDQAQPAPHNEAAQVLKNSLLPLLGDIVVKYYRNEPIRDMVMVVVHNIVRLDQGGRENLKEAIDSLVRELGKQASLPPQFAEKLQIALFEAAQEIKNEKNEIMERLVEAVTRCLEKDTEATPVLQRQAEQLLLGLLQNQSSAMNLIHFMLPMELPGDRVLAEVYVDPDSEEKPAKGKGEKQSRKLFLTFSSERHGLFEMSVLQEEDRVALSLWCPSAMVEGMRRLKRQLGLVAQAYGYQLAEYDAQVLQKPQSVAQVFPYLLNRRSGIDVRV